MIIFYYVTLIIFCIKQVQMQRGTILDKTEVFEGEAVTINCSASRTPVQITESNCTHFLHLLRKRKTTDDYKKLATYDLDIGLFFTYVNKTTWRYEHYDKSTNKDNVCQNFEAIGVVLYIEKAEIDDAAYYKCVRELAVSDFVVLSIGVLTVLPAAQRKTTPMKVTTVESRSGTENPNSAEGNTPGPREGNTHGPIEGNTHGPIEGNTHGPIEGNTHRPIEGNTHGPIEGNTHEPMEGNTPGPMEGNTPGPMEGNTPGPIEGNTPGPMENNTASTEESTTSGAMSSLSWYWSSAILLLLLM